VVLVIDHQWTSDNPTIDLRYWCLLRQVLDASVGVNARGPKVWLGSLLNRTPLAPIILSTLTLLRDLSDADSKSLLLLVRPCFSVLWPLSVHKMGVEMLLECFGTVLDVSSDLGSDDALESMCEAIVCSYREAFGNAGNKKKVHNKFFFYSERLIFIFVAAHHLPPDPSLILDSCSLTIISSASTAERSGIRLRNGDAVFPRCAPCIFLIGESIHSPVFFPQLIVNKYRYPTPLSPLQRPYALPAALPHHFVSRFPE
jgi:hypothetical protein